MRPSIEISSICNLKCKMCPYQHKNIKLGMMTWDKFTELADGLSNEEAVHIFNRGEPFTHPRVYDMIDYLQEKGTPIIISTNALLMDEKKIFDHFRKGLLVISCHAGNKETYKQITGTDGFDEVKRKILYIQDHKPEGIDFRTKIVQLPENKGQEEELKKWCDRLDIVEDSNQNNPHNYTGCSQPDVCPTWDFLGNKKVCCRDEHSLYDWDKFNEQGRRRELEICQRCNIR